MENDRQKSGTESIGSNVLNKKKMSITICEIFTKIYISQKSVRIIIITYVTIE